MSSKSCSSTTNEHTLYLTNLYLASELYFQQLAERTNFYYVRSLQIDEEHRTTHLLLYSKQVLKKEHKEARKDKKYKLIHLNNQQLSLESHVIKWQEQGLSQKISQAREHQAAITSTSQTNTFRIAKLKKQIEEEKAKKAELAAQAF
mmetsp:Transcript_18723/g.28718  ORF Transcript_18723/g.28718 Transcript_18723/m.28718 type:complete len:147 (-) Transcript_18723:235-675(-)|eukprot:CAMPEP_0170482282 /NCGR_PEP_ID=MMETSP0208-20121228/2370_1 /TAXON_ID=197538 /ORGANISM="Strombidium inclinatum, Strain S3" /LENGTH=146 /DNA_ID=CAMNT_0010755109 /DNA_START=1444 /DNA_END=1884 /DNA_ORIENTATION=-